MVARQIINIDSRSFYIVRLLYISLAKQASISQKRRKSSSQKSKKRQLTRVFLNIKLTLAISRFIIPT